MNWQYLGGFFDGKGHVGVHKGRGKYTQHDITIANTHEGTIDAISRFLRSQNIKHSKFKRVHLNPNWKIAFKIKVTGIRPGIVFLGMILPYLITKKEQALSTLEWLRRQTPKVLWSKESFENALNLYRQGKTLRQVGGIIGMDAKTLRLYGKRTGFKFRTRSEAMLLHRKSSRLPSQR